MRSYALLAAVMDQRQKVGIGKVVMREKQYLAAIRPYGKGLALSNMLFADEVVPQSDIDDIPARRAALDDRQKKMAGQIVESLEREWDPKRYHDDYEEGLRKVIATRSKGTTIETATPEPGGEVLDLMDALRASLDRGRSNAKTSTARRSKAHAQKAKPKRRPATPTRSSSGRAR